ncbi:unnamed protein product [Victoria cruziana]
MDQGPAAFSLGLDPFAPKHASLGINSDLWCAIPLTFGLEREGAWSFGAKASSLPPLLLVFHLLLVVPFSLRFFLFHLHSPSAFRVESILGAWRSSSFKLSIDQEWRAHFRFIWSLEVATGQQPIHGVDSSMLSLLARG